MMTIKELKNFLSTLPEEFDEFTMSNGEVGKVETEEGFYYRLDKPIRTLFVDEENKELCFLHQTEDEVSKIENAESDLPKESDENGNKE